MQDPTLEQLAAVLEGSKIRNGELRACCPAHGGQDANLAITYRDGKLLATCHSHQCSFEQIMTAIRERLGSEATSEERHAVTFGSKRNGKATRQTWELRDAAGELVAQHIREDVAGGKHIRWRMPDGTWKLDRPTAQLPLYGAQEAATAPAGTSIVVCEGEKATDALRAVCTPHRAPLVAVGTVTGATGTPSAESLEVLRGRTVILWPDADAPGFEHMGRIAEALIGVASEVRWFEWEGAPEKGDAADHPGTRDAAEFVRGGLLHQLLSAERWSRPPAIEGRMLVGQAIEKGVEPPEELLPDILLSAKAHNIYAPGGVGKTWVLVWLATQLVKRGRRVVVFDLENGLRTYSERFEEMGGDSLDPTKLDELLFYYPFPMLNREVYERMLEEDKPDVVMFDSWIGFLAADGRDENVSNDISAWADAYSKPALRRGVAVVVLDHVPHEHERERGSTRKRDEMDVVWKLVKLGDFDRDHVAELSMTLQKDREGWLPFKLGWRVGGDPETGRFVMERDDALAHDASIQILNEKERAAMAALENLGSAAAEEWRRVGGLDLSKTAFYRVVNSLIEKGKVRKKEKTYHLVETLDVVVRSGPGVVRGPSGPTENRGAPTFGPVVHPLIGGVDLPGPNVSEASPAPEGENKDVEELQDLGSRLRQIRDDLRRQRDT